MKIRLVLILLLKYELILFRFRHKFDLASKAEDTHPEVILRVAEKLFCKLGFFSGCRPRNKGGFVL